MHQAGFWALGLAGIVLFATDTLGRPSPPLINPPAQIAESAAFEAQRFAIALRQYFDGIQENFFRPVSTAELAKASLQGLFEAARQSPPPGFDSIVEKADAERRLDELVADTYLALAGNDAVRGRDRALLVALHSLPAALDQYSGPIGHQPFRQLDFPTSIRSAGIIFTGMNLGTDRPRFDNSGASLGPPLPPGPLRVQQVLPGGPGQIAGIQADDLIVSINGRASSQPGFAEEAARLLPIAREERSRENGVSNVGIVRAGKTGEIPVTLKLQSFRPESLFGCQRRSDGSWDYLLDPANRIGYIRMGPIWDSSHGEFCQVMDRLSSLEMQGLILDLRWCPGGLLVQSASIARQLLPRDSIIISQPENSRKPLSLLMNTPDVQRYTEFPLVVIVNSETSGGGELIAAAIQDHRRGTIVGQRTIGKASVQTPLLNVDYSFKVTTNLFHRPSGRNMQRFPESGVEDDWGVRPDPGCDIRFTPELDRKLKNLWTSHAMRPPGERWGLPTDDPDCDPVRQAAWYRLREMIMKPKS